MIWNQLSHPNILPFLGIADIPGLSTCLVSPWIDNGNSVAYLTEHPDVMPLPIVSTLFKAMGPGSITDHVRLQVLGIVRGLEYLHKYNPSIIHGDLRGVSHNSFLFPGSADRGIGQCFNI